MGSSSSSCKGAKVGCPVARPALRMGGDPELDELVVSVFTSSVDSAGCRAVPASPNTEESVEDGPDIASVLRLLTCEVWCVWMCVLCAVVYALLGLSVTDLFHS